MRCATFGLPQHEFLTWASNFLLIMRHKCPENVKIAIKTILCTYGFRDFLQKLKITTFALFGGKFFSHGHFLQTPSSGAHDHVLVQNISFFGIYQVQNLVYY